MKPLPLVSLVILLFAAGAHAEQRQVSVAAGDGFALQGNVASHADVVPRHAASTSILASATVILCSIRMGIMTKPAAECGRFGRLYNKEQGC